MKFIKQKWKIVLKKIIPLFIKILSILLNNLPIINSFNVTLSIYNFITDPNP